MGKLDEVVYLVEWPVVLEGRFDERYLRAARAGRRSRPCSRTSATSRSCADGPAWRRGSRSSPTAATARRSSSRATRRCWSAGCEDAAFALREGPRPRAWRRCWPSWAGSASWRAAARWRTRARGCAGAGRAAGRPGRGRAGHVRRRAVARAAELCKADLVSSAGRRVLRPAGLCGLGLRPPGGRAGRGLRRDRASTTSRSRPGARCPPARRARCCRSPTRPTRRGRLRARARSRPAAAIRTGCAAPPPASWRSRSTRGFELGLAELMAASVQPARRAGLRAEAKAARGGAGGGRVRARPGGAGAAGRRGSPWRRCARPAAPGHAGPGAAGGAVPGAARRPRQRAAGRAARRLRPLLADRCEGQPRRRRPPFDTRSSRGRRARPARGADRGRQRAGRLRRRAARLRLRARCGGRAGRRRSTSSSRR